jgi:hypothetical protein
MLWYKAWLETRWRFIIPMIVMVCSSVGIVFTWPATKSTLLPLAANVTQTGEIGRQIREALELSKTYPGYIFSQLWSQNLRQMATLFAALLGTGGLLAQTSGGGALFTLSLPASRNEIVGVRAAIGCAEFFAIVFGAAILIPVFSPAVGESYGIGESLAHAAFLFLGGLWVFSLAFLLSTIFSDIWRPLMMTLLVAIVLALAEMFFDPLSGVGIFSAMSGEAFFRSGTVPWPALLISIALSAIMLWTAARITAARDF